MVPDAERPWTLTAPDQLVAEGHGAGDILEAWKWRVVDRGSGRLEVVCRLPEQLKNPQGQLFGGFTPTYVDFVSLYTVHSIDPDWDPTSPKTWLTTINMRCDYYEPITGDFRVVGEVQNQRGLTFLVSTKFYVPAPDGGADVMAAHALTTLRQIPGMTNQP